MVWPALRDFLDVPASLTGRGVCIAIVDGGFPPHPDIATNSQRASHIVYATCPDPRLRRLEATTGPWPGGAHGLWAAAAAAGSGADSKGQYAGLAPGADLVLVAMQNPDHEFEAEEDTCSALEWLLAHARELGVRAVLVSIVGQHDSGLLPWQAERGRRLCEALADTGLLVVAGTGNMTDLTCIATHAAAPSVLSVGGIIIPPSGRLAEAAPYHGCRGETFEGKRIPELLAPAENVVLPYGREEYLRAHFTAPTDGLPAGYGRTEGTSFSGPIVLGAAACVWQAHPDWSAGQVKQALRSSATMAPQWQRELGAGVVSVQGAIAAPVRECRAGNDSPHARRLEWRSRPLPDCVRIAGHGGPGTTEALLSHLPDALPDDALPGVRALVEHPSPEARTAALCLLATRPDALTMPELLPRLADADAYVRVAAVFAVEHCPGLWREVVVLLPGLFRDPNLDVRYSALRLAARIKHPSLVAPLISGLEEDAALGRIGSYGHRLEALKAITGLEMPRVPEWQEGECPYSERSRLALLDIAARWRASLAGSG